MAGEPSKSPRDTEGLADVVGSWTRLNPDVLGEAPLRTGLSSERNPQPLPPAAEPAPPFVAHTPGTYWTVHELVQAYATHAVAPTQVVNEYLDRMREASNLNAYLWSDAAVSSGQAEEAARRLSEGHAALLTGIPLAVKDNIDTQGIPTTRGSLADGPRVPQRDAEVWSSLREQGAVLLGKAHLWEFAYSMPHEALPPPRNPYDERRSPGGSSSGSAVAVAAGLAPAALGTDTGGSVRVPAAYCGIVGLKPTRGLISADGIAPLSWTLDQVGVLTNTVADAALLLDQTARRPISGVDWAHERLPVPDPSRLVVGIDPSTLELVDEDTAIAWEACRAAFEGAGASFRPVRLPAFGINHLVHRTILLSEAFSYHRQRLERGLPLGAAFAAFVSKGRAIPAAQYVDALRWQGLVQAELADTLSLVDAVLLPTVPGGPQPLGQPNRPNHTRNTFLANLCGVPAISLPVGYDRDGMPVGMQLLAAANRDLRLLEAASVLEREMAFRPRYRKFAGG